MPDDYPYPEHDWTDPADAVAIEVLQARPEAVPSFNEGLITALRNRREWQNRCPDPSWSDKQIQQNIGANAVIEYMEQLLEQQRGAPAK